MKCSITSIFEISYVSVFGLETYFKLRNLKCNHFRIRLMNTDTQTDRQNGIYFNLMAVS